MPGLRWRRTLRGRIHVGHLQPNPVHRQGYLCLGILGKLPDDDRVTATVWCLGLLAMHHLATRRSQGLSSQQQKRSGTRLDVIRGSCDLAYAVEETLGREQTQMSNDRELVRDLSALHTRLRYRDGWESGDDGARVTSSST